MASELRRAVALLSVSIVGLIAVPAVLFPEASCLSAGAHYNFCEIGRLLTALVLLVAVVGLPVVTWLIDPE